MSCPVFVHIDNEGSLFFLSKKCAIWKIVHFCSFPLFERAITLFCCSFEKGDRKSNRSFQKSDKRVIPLLHKTTKRAIAHSLISKVGFSSLTVKRKKILKYVILANCLDLLGNESLFWSKSVYYALFWSNLRHVKKCGLLYAHISWGIGVLQIFAELMQLFTSQKTSYKHQHIASCRRCTKNLKTVSESGHQEDLKTVFKIFIQCLQPEICWCLYYVRWEENNCARPGRCSYSPLKKRLTNIDISWAVDIVQKI